MSRLTARTGDPGPRGRRALLVGVIALIVTVILGLFDLRALLEAWLGAAVCWVAVPLGALGILMTHRLSGGLWGEVTADALDGAIRTLPLTALSFVPVLAGVTVLYPWAGSEAGAPDIVNREPYLDVWFFILRTIIYFAVWMILAGLLLRGNRRSPESLYRQRPVAGFGLVVMSITVTFASIDWMMTLEPRFRSSAYGLIFLVGDLLTALSLIVIISLWLQPSRHPAAQQGDAVPGGLGGLLLGLVMLWIYVSFMQYLVIWSGDLPDEVFWYLKRAGGLWLGVLWAIGILHGLVPFLALVVARVRHRRRWLLAVAALIFVMRLVETLWYTLPAFAETPAWYLAILGVLATIGLGGLWLALFFWLTAGERQPAAAAPREAVEHG